MNTSNISIIYATLILEGRKTFSQVPVNLKAEVKELLVSWGREDLAQ
jgi:hypothetical protein